MINSVAIETYLNQFHPSVFKEISERLSSIPCEYALIKTIYIKAKSSRQEKWELQLITIAATLALCSPETLYVGSRVRLGVAKTLAEILEVSQQRVSQKFESASHYYKNISWCRESVDKIVREVRENG